MGMNPTIGKRIIGIDPATKTGFVALDEKGEVMIAKEITGNSSQIAESRIRALHDEILRHLQPEDVIGIEWFALTATDTNKTSSGANWAARLAADRATKNAIISPLPGDVKKWVGVSEWSGEKGKKVRKKGPAVKKEVMEAVDALYGFKPRTDNIADAYVIARIVKAVCECKINGMLVRSWANPAQIEIIERLAYPEAHKRKMQEEKKAKAARKKAREGVK